MLGSEGLRTGTVLENTAQSEESESPQHPLHLLLQENSVCDSSGVTQLCVISERMLDSLPRKDEPGLQRTVIISEVS